MLRIAINGFGRIGRLAARQILNDESVKLVAINDLADLKTNAHLFKYDSNYGAWPGSVTFSEGLLTVDGHDILCFSERDPAKLPWAEHKIDLVIECTGIFTSRDGCMLHINAGAKKVVISAPGRNEDITIVLGVNEGLYDHENHHIISNASCTTNCLAPVAKVINDTFGIVKGTMTTIHAYTNDQNILDVQHRDLRRARASALSIIPTTTGAASAVSLVIPELKGKLNGFALRVPTPTVSVVDLVCEVSKETDAAAVNAALQAAADSSMKGILAVCDSELVSIDFKGSDYSSIVDAPLTMVMGKNLVKVVAWYDNEWGYAHRLIDLVCLIARKGV